MKFMGDLPLSKHQKETDLVFNLLKVGYQLTFNFFFNLQSGPILSVFSFTFGGAFAKTGFSFLVGMVYQAKRK